MPKLHLRDEAEGGKGRSRRRTKSVSDSSAAGARRNSTSPYAVQAPIARVPNRRQSDISANRPAPLFTAGFAYAGLPAIDTSIRQLSASVPSSSRFSTSELLGLIYPNDASNPANGAYSPLPTLAELYPSDSPALTSNGFDSHSSMNAFSSFSPMTRSLFFETHTQPINLEAAPSPFFSGSDDGSSNASDPSSFGPSSFTSSLATSIDSQPDSRALMNYSAMAFPGRIPGDEERTPF